MIRFQKPSAIPVTASRLHIGQTTDSATTFNANADSPGMLTRQL